MRFAYDVQALIGVGAVALIGGLAWTVGAWIANRLLRRF
jgi:hypothetical protein